MRVLTLIVAGTSIAVLVLGVRAVSARKARPTEVEAVTKELTPERATPPVMTAPRPPRLTRGPASARPAHEIAHVRGRVIAPAGVSAEALADDLEVAANDGARTYEAKTNDRGDFELHLPPRTYTINATLGALVGTVEVRASGNEDVTITLAPAVTIAGTVEPDSDPDLAVSAVRAGTTIPIGGRPVGGGGAFLLEGLVPGVAYDLKFEGSGLRSSALRGVIAPAQGLKVRMDPLPTLRGAIGFAPGDQCEFSDVEVELGDGHRDAHVDKNCHFIVTELPADKDELVVRAERAGWHLEVRVPMPEQGDPPFVCLNPPCRDLPPEERASLEVMLIGAPGRTSLNASLSRAHEGESCSTSHGGSCHFGDKIAGEYELSIHTVRCEVVTRKVTLRPGKNELAIPCRRTREIQGTLRTAAGTVVPSAADVRCPSGETLQVSGDFVFMLHCPLDQKEIQYRGNGTGDWRSAPLAPGVDPVLIDLTL